MQHLVDRVRRAADRPDGGIEVVTLPRGDPAIVSRALIPDALRLGFVPIVVSDDSPQEMPPAISHRHVLIVCADAGAVNTVISWARMLAWASPRGHVIVRFEHRAPDAPPDGPALLSPAVVCRLARARRWIRRGRHRSADRWLAAAAEAARRRGDLTLGASVDLEAIKLLLDVDQVADAAGRLRQRLGPDVDWSTYARASALWADVLIAREQFSRARAWLTSAVAEAELRSTAIPIELRSRLAELDFWQGRTSLDGPNPQEPIDPNVLGWLALSAWSRGNSALIALLAARISTGLDSTDGNDRARDWFTLIRVLMGSTAPLAEIEKRITALLLGDERNPCRSARFQRLSLAVSAVVWLKRHEPQRAAQLLEISRGPGPEGTVCARLRERLKAEAAPLIDGAPALARRPCNESPAGMEFMISGSTHMHLVDGLSRLLAVIEDADDDAAVLAGGCRWVCRQAGASAVAIVSADGATLAAAEGWRRTDLAGEIREILEGPARDLRLPDHDREAGSFGVSVRYGGVTIGMVVVRGQSAERPGLEQAAHALAALCGSALRARLDVLTAAQRSHAAIPEIVGNSPLIDAVRESIMRAAAAPFPVLIEGESGTGKELVARALHRLGPRRDRRLSAVNCAALTDDLVEAELFGHVRGAFTGAVGPRAGLFEEAHGGTLFLDEVTELSPRAQAKLLRVLQEREVRRVGENASRTIDVRVIAACNVPVAEAVAAGRFRGDLRFRLAVVRLCLPPLRDRLEDVPALARAFWGRAVADANTRAVLGPDALARLTRHPWPGNVRELQNVVAGLVVGAPARGRVTARHVDQVLSQVAGSVEAPGIPLESARRTFERRLIASALVRHAGRRGAVATELGLTRQGLTKALRRLGLSTEAARNQSAHDDVAGVA